jgi:hypothetical protein
MPVPVFRSSSARRYAAKAPASELWDSFPPGTLTVKPTGLEISAGSVEPLPAFVKRQGGALGYQAAVALTVSLASQYSRLVARGFVAPLYSTSDVLVIDGQGYLANPAAVVAQGSRVNMPVRDAQFVPPELRAIEGTAAAAAPAGYYTLACVVTNAIFPGLPEAPAEEAIAGALEPIIGLPLYWCLLRCLAAAPEDRAFLLL